MGMWVPVIIGAASALCVVLLLSMVSWLGKPRTDGVSDGMTNAFAENPAALSSEIATIAPFEAPTEVPTPTPEPTAEPTEAPTPMPTPVPQPTLAPEQEEAAFESTQTPAPAVAASEPFAYLPVVHQANIQEKKIAITVDDCFQIDNLKHIIRLAYNKNGKLTIFPIGQNVVKGDMDGVLKACVFDLGFEIENHTWSHSRVFRLSEQEMAAEIWKQRAAVSSALGVNYQQHFFRLMGGDGEYDQRTHNYLKQLGFLGIANWSYSGSDADIANIKATLKPGMIYLFHTTDGDTKKLDEFIPYAVSQGYELVTLNNLLGLPENTWTDISTMEREMPQPQPYTVEYREEKKGDYSWAIINIQNRLHELGYLKSGSKSAVKGTVADGVYGDGTAKAVAAFQRDHGLEPTGVADVATQEKLFSN